jgi:hypothetical protein
MGKYFTIEELCRSEKAKELGISNLPSTENVVYMRRLIETILDPIREKWGKPIYVNSGFRNLALNKAVGGRRNSHHLCKNGYAAADIDTYSTEDNKKLFNLIKSLNLPICQCIDEKSYQWIHVSYNPSDIRRQYLHEG